ncbi:putative alpha-xylosidase [Hypoxylon sp. FL1284]|nr:putative alpha-xylosidase [Hypoxylon sp. FL1284]
MEEKEQNTNEYTAWRVIVFIGFFIPLQVGLVVLRFYARSLTAAKYDLGDVLIAIALIAQIIGFGLDIGAVTQGGVGYHIEYLEQTNPEIITTFFKYLVALSVWYFATNTITKLAICKLYRVLFPGRRVFIVLCITAIVLVATPVATVTVLLAACRPFSAKWGSAETQATHCLNKEAVFVWGALPNIVTDVVLLAIPIPIIWKLNATARLKIALFFTFAIGSVGLLASILRFMSFYNTNSFIDGTFHAVELIIWTIVEPGMYLISACLLVFRPLLEKANFKIFANIKSYIASSRSKAASSRVTETSHGDHRKSSGGRVSIIRAIRRPNDGFHQLGDIESDPSGRQITITTNIQQSWDTV